MEFKVLDVTEEPETKRVIVFIETQYGERRVKLPPSSKFLNPDTKQPQWLHDVKAYIEQSYPPLPKDAPSKEFENFIGMGYDTNKIQDTTPNGLQLMHQEKMKKRVPLEQREAEVNAFNNKLIGLCQKRIRLESELKKEEARIIKLNEEIERKKKIE